MAGGKGTRLRPLTCGIPKPMVPLFDKPVMEYTLELLKKHSLYDVAVTLSYLPYSIIDYFGEGEKYDLNIKYFIEKTALGTGGSVRNADDFINETVLVISGDSLTDLDLTKAIEFHKHKNSKATIILKRVLVPIEYGVIITNNDEKIVRFLEKPSWGEVFSDTVNTGIYILEPEVLMYYKKGENFDFSKDLFPKLLKDKVPMYGYTTEDYWCDIGDLLSYRQTHFDILDKKIKVELDKKEMEKGIWIGEDVYINSSVQLIPPLYIGNKSIIEKGASIGSYSIISNNCKIGERSKLKRSIIWKNAVLGNNSNISGSVICENSIIKDKVNIYENTVIGQDSILLDNTIIKPEVKIWPEKKVLENTIVSQNIIWGTKATKSVFGVKGVSGIINQEITPEFCSRLGSAFSSAIGTTPFLTIGSDNKNQSQIVKNSIIAGILSAGGQCVSIKNSIIPMTRFGVRYYKCSGGINIFTSSTRPFKTYIEFFNNRGINIDRNMERNIENLLNSGAYNRCKMEDIKPTVNIENFKSLYIKQGISNIRNIKDIRRRNYQILLSSKSENATDIANEYLSELGCDVFLAESARNKKLDLSIIIKENGENMKLLDEKGRAISDEEYLLFTGLIAIKGYNTKKLVFPYAFPNTAEEIAKKYEAHVLRTTSDVSSVMNKIIQLDVDSDNLPIQFVLNYDPIWAMGHILEYLSKEHINISQHIMEIPKFYFSKKELSCDWEDKGRVIRKISDKTNENVSELLEGIKIKDHRGWALVLPDNEKPIFNIYTQGLSEEMAKELSADLIDRISALLKKQGFKKE